MISYEDLVTNYDGKPWNHPDFSREKVERIAGREISQEEYECLLLNVGYISSDLGKYNSISIYEDVGVLTHGNDALVSKEKLLEIIMELIDHYANYDKRYEVFMQDCIRTFNKACAEYKVIMK